jgi:hypothetical protein
VFKLLIGKEVLLPKLNYLFHAFTKFMQKVKSIKRPKLQTMAIKEGDEVQVKGIHNIFNKIIAENFQDLEKQLSTQM